MKLSFVALTESHFPLLLKWLKTPHVKAWWDQDIAWTPELIQEKYGSYVKGYKSNKDSTKPIHAYIICVDENPIGYIQIYNAYDFPRTTPLLGMPEKLAALDIFIGEVNYLNRGIGSKVINQFLNQFATSYSHVFVDPDSANITAIRAYQKAGFTKTQYQPNTNEIWMLREQAYTTNKKEI